MPVHLSGFFAFSFSFLAWPSRNAPFHVDLFPPAKDTSTPYGEAQGLEPAIATPRGK